MTYTTPTFAANAGLPYALMKNNAGTLLSSDLYAQISKRLTTHGTAGVVVNASTDAVESAMEEVYDLVNAGNLAVDVMNGSQPTSWPMCMLSFAVFFTNQSRADCSQLTEFISFFAWAQLNQRAEELMRSLGYSPLSLAYKAYLSPHHPLSQLPFPSEIEDNSLSISLVPVNALRLCKR
jgi:hypothetical protein